MPRRPDKDLPDWKGRWEGKLAGVEEFAYLFGVSKSTISRLVDDGLMPEPDDRIAAGRIWRRETIDWFLGAVAELAGEHPTPSWQPSYGVSRFFSAPLRREMREAIEVVRREHRGLGSHTHQFNELVRERYWTQITKAAETFKKRQKRAQKGSSSTGTRSARSTR